MRRVAVAVAAASLAVACRIGTDALAPAPAAPRLVVTPDSLAFHGRAGASLLPDQYLSISFDAAVSGRWYATTEGSWFLLESTGDTLPYFLPVGPRPAGMAPGSYGGMVWVVAENDTVPVAMTLQLDSAASVAGRWVASRDTLRLELDLADSGGAVTGSGFLSPPQRGVTVTGARSDTAVSLSLTVTNDTLEFSGLLVGEDSLVGTLTGGNLSGFALTLFRQ